MVKKEQINLVDIAHLLKIAIEYSCPVKCKVMGYFIAAN